MPITAGSTFIISNPPDMTKVLPDPAKCWHSFVNGAIDESQDRHLLCPMMALPPSSDQSSPIALPTIC
jgi:hypothetical protein